MKRMKKISMILMIALFAFPFLSEAQSNAWKDNFGRVKRLYPSVDKFLFSLKDGITSMDPKGGFYYIPRDHKNYRTLSDLLIKAAENQWIIQVKTAKELDAKGFAKVTYLVVDFE